MKTNEVRPIDADALLDCLEMLRRNYTLKAGYRDAMTDAIGEVRDALTIDAVPVVRCKECVCSSRLDDQLVCSRISEVMDGYYHGTVDVVKPDDYCSHGIRETAKPIDVKMGAE